MRMNKGSKIIIDVSSFVCQSVMTGIQRVVAEYTSRIVKNNKNVYLIMWNKKNSFYLINNDFYLENYFKLNRNVFFTNTKHMLFDFSIIDSSFIFLDLDASWDVGNCYSRNKLYKNLKLRNCKIITLVHDILPVTSPQYWPIYSDTFLYYICAIVKYSDKIIFTTEHVKKIFINFSTKLYKNKCSIVKLGCDLKKTYDPMKISQKIKDISNKKYLLTVSTLEPRKNHLTILKAYLSSEISENYSLIFAGRYGWMYEEILNFIKNNKKISNKVVLINDANDDEIIFLYKNCSFFIFASFDEGYGLPLVEALYYNCNILVSNIEVFREIAGNFAIYFNPNNYLNLSEILNKINNGIIEKIEHNFKSISWDDSYNILIKEILS